MYYVCVCVGMTGNVYVLLHFFAHAPSNTATAFYCFQTLIKMWLAWEISVINEINSGLFVVAVLLVVLPSWHWRHSSLTSSLLLFNLSYNTAVYLFSSRRLISYITTTAHSTAIMPLTPKGSLTVRHAAMSLCFLMGRRMLSYTSPSRGTHPECSLCLDERGFAITKIINNCTTYGNFPALQANLWLSLAAMCHWFGWHSVHAVSAWRINFHYHSW